MYSSLSGCCETRSFTTKAGAMSFAICCSMADGKVDYKEAKKLFDFICKNVKLPDTEPDQVGAIANIINGAIVREQFRA